MKKILTLIFTAFFGLLFLHTIFGENAPQQPAKAIPPLDMNKLTTGEQALKVGYMKNFPPFYLESTGSIPQGMDADIFQAVSQRAGIKRPEYLNYDNFKDLADALKTGKIDIIVNDYWNFPDDEDKFLHTIPYYIQDGIAFAFRRDKHGFETINDLKHKKIGIYGSETDLVEWVKEHPTLNNITLYHLPNELMQDLKDNKIDAAFVNYTLFLHDYHQDQSKFPFRVVMAKAIPSTYALRKQDVTLQKKLNQVLEQMWEDDSLYQLKAKYLKPLGIQEPERSYQ